MVQASADLAWQQERSKLQSSIAAAQQRAQDLERVNAQLQVHLDNHARAAAGQAPDEGSFACSKHVLTWCAISISRHNPICVFAALFAF